MEFLHVADSATHLGASGIVASGIGVIGGALLVFGLPALLQRRGGHGSKDQRAEEPEVVSLEGDDHTHRS